MLDEVLNCVDPTLHVVFSDWCVFLLPDDQDIWELAVVGEGLFAEMDFSFVDHSHSLEVIMCFSVLDDFSVGFTDDWNYKVHENHEKNEHTPKVNQPREIKNELWMPVNNNIFFTFNRWWNDIFNDIEGLVRIQQREVTHGHPEYSHCMCH